MDRQIPDYDYLIVLQGFEKRFPVAFVFETYGEVVVLQVSE